MLLLVGLLLLLFWRAWGEGGDFLFLFTLIKMSSFVGVVMVVKEGSIAVVWGRALYCH